MALDELSPLRGRSSGGRHRWWLDRLANVHEDFADRPRIGDERDEADVAATHWALEGKLLPHPGHELGPGNP